ncbi:MAG: hypothetical protein Q8K86_09900 [Candidatus Nanopelagicaceae bacterium]|nr:hypothetical protein [Candidatus Nanopelagicaceae bacterium]
MSECAVGREPGSIFISNREKVPKLILLFPITRTGENAIKSWERLIETVSKSEVHALVVIDKTNGGEATEFFTGNEERLETQLFVLRRSSEEQIFDSQKFIELDDLLWIGQLHDDDNWTGTLRLPKGELDRATVFLCDFVVDKGDEVARPEPMPPARVVFSWIPSFLWNEVCNFIYAQGGHIAGSIDSTIAMVSLMSCETRNIEGFRYVYSDHHWGERAEAEAHLKKLSFTDGWGDFSGSDVAVLNRTLDNLSALHFFREYLSMEDIEAKKNSLLATFKPSLRKRGIVSLRLLLSAISNPLLSTLRLALLPFKGSALISRLISRNRASWNLNWLIYNSWNVRDPEDVVQFVRRYMSPSQFPRLSKRFAFWQTEIASL